MLKDKELTVSKRSRPVRIRTVDSGAPPMEELHRQDIDWEILSKEAQKRKSLRPGYKRARL